PPPTQEAADAVYAEYGIPPGTVNVTADPDRPVVNEIYFNPDGSPFILQGAVNYRGPLGSTERGYGFAGMRINPNGNLGQVFFDGIASTPLERRAAFGRAFYRLTDNVTAFAQVTYSNVEVTTNGGYPDRKSTRLNSSHVKISYAVFCLKKKNDDCTLGGF